MKVRFQNNEFLIVPETDFEKQVIADFNGVELNAFVKCGLTASEVLGLKIKKELKTQSKQS